MSDIDARDFGKLEAQVASLQAEVHQLATDVKALLEFLALHQKLSLLLPSGKLDLKFLFQLLDGNRQSGLGHVTRVSSTSKMPLACHGNNIFELCKCHVSFKCESRIVHGLYVTWP